MQDATISLAITPSLPVSAKHDLIVGGGWGQARGGEMFLTLIVEGGCFREVAGMSIVDAGGSRSQ